MRRRNQSEKQRNKQWRYTWVTSAIFFFSPFKIQTRSQFYFFIRDMFIVKQLKSNGVHKRENAPWRLTTARPVSIAFLLFQFKDVFLLENCPSNI